MPSKVPGHMPNLTKAVATWCISNGLRLPEQQLERLHELVALRKLLLQLQIDCVLDVGANRGQFAGELRQIGFQGFIISFEPVADEFGALKTRFQDDPRWRGYRFALGSSEETLSITVPKLTVMSSLLESTVTDTEDRREVVEVKRLDRVLPPLMAELGVSNIFLKMDTQGYDLRVFTGASGCIDKIRGIQSELSVQPIYKNMPHYLEALSLYEAHGFELYNLSVVNRVSGGGILELNCFMRRP